MAAAFLSNEDEDFLAQCEEELKDRFTEKDEEFMKVYNSEPSTPPVVENWSPNSGRRNDRQNNRRFHPYSRYGNRDKGHQDRRDHYDHRGYDDNRPRRRYY